MQCQCNAISSSNFSLSLSERTSCELQFLPLVLEFPKARFHWVSQPLNAKKIHKSPAQKLLAQKILLNNLISMLDFEQQKSGKPHITSSLTNAETKENSALLSQLSLRILSICCSSSLDKPPSKESKWLPSHFQGKNQQPVSKRQCYVTLSCW